MWTGKQHQKRDHRGKDQPALDAAALRFGQVEALPTTFDLKPNHCQWNPARVVKPQFAIGLIAYFDRP